MESSAAAAEQQEMPEPEQQQERAAKRGKLEKAQLDLATLKDGLKENLKRVEPLKAKDAVFFVGNTGTGKSTTINFLLGCEMVKRSAFLGKCSFQCPDAIAAIGHGAQACTEYPQAYQSPSNDQLCLVDCPGFNDSRGMLKETLCNMCTHFAIQMAARIRAVALVIDCESITGQRGSSIKSLLQTVSHLITLQESDPCPLLFLVTKVPSSGDAVKARDEFLEHVPNLKDGLPPEWKEAAGQLFDMMVANPDNVFVIDLEAAPQRQAILDRAQQMAAIERSRFRLVAHTGSQRLLRDILDSIAQVATPLISTGIHYQQAIQFNEKEVARLSADIMQCGNTKVDTDLEPQLLLKQYQDQLGREREMLMVLKTQQCLLDKDNSYEQTNYESWVTKMDQAPDVVHWSDECTDNNLFFVPTKEFEYEGIPFTTARATSSNEGTDCFVEEQSSPAEGKYRVKYTVTDRVRFLNFIPYRPHAASAKVEIFVKARSAPSAVREEKVRLTQLENLQRSLKDTEQKHQTQIENVRRLENAECRQQEQITTYQAQKEALRQSIIAMQDQNTQQQQMLKNNMEELDGICQKVKHIEGDIKLSAHLAELHVLEQAESPAAGWQDPNSLLQELWLKFSSKATN